MLVLSRYKDQSIYIGDDIVITVVDVRGDRIRLGIEAPSDVPVHRQEIYEAIKKEEELVQCVAKDTADNSVENQYELSFHNF
ncbi:MAG: carbon storage regulator CsrA [Planctomycetia bacterium]|nr:carbon storage regulator CsrA [Planctomycetia bacterium]